MLLFRVADPGGDGLDLDNRIHNNRDRHRIRPSIESGFELIKILDPDLQPCIITGAF